MVSSRLGLADMRLIQKIFIFTVALEFICGCSYHQGQFQPSAVTEVHLEKANYVVIDHIEASASATYLLSMNFNYQSLFDDALKSLMEKAAMKGKPRALVNLTEDKKFEGIWPLVFTKTIYVSANVIEFKDELNK